MPQAAGARLRIAVVRTSSIGDVVLASACLSCAKALGIDVVWLGRRGCNDLLASAWPDVSFVEMPEQQLRNQFAAFVQEYGQVDAVVDLQTSVRSRIFMRQAKQAGVVCVAASKLQWYRYSLLVLARLRGRVFPRRTWSVGAVKSEGHRQFVGMLQAFAHACVKLGVERDSVQKAMDASKPDLRQLAEDPIDAAWGRELQFGAWIAIAPGAAHPAKQCTLDVWLEILKDFVGRTKLDEPLGLLITGGEADRKSAVELVDRLQWTGPLLNMTGRLSLIDTAKALSKVNMLLTNDSGLLHIAEAVGTPVVVAFGPTTEDFGFYPWLPDSMTFSSPVGCRPCSKHGKLECRYGDQLCFETLPIPTMSRAVSDVFAHQNNKRGRQIEHEN